MTRPPPTATPTDTLFPYPPLFRSRYPQMACEVFVEHDSDPARVFHGSFGFHEVGQHVMPGTDGEPSGIRASMLIKEMCSYAWVRERSGAALPNAPWLPHPPPRAPAPHPPPGTRAWTPLRPPRPPTTRPPHHPTPPTPA